MLKQDLNWCCMTEPWHETSKSAEIVTLCSYGYFLLKLFDMVETVKIEILNLLRYFPQFFETDFLRAAEKVKSDLLPALLPPRWNIDHGLRPHEVQLWRRAWHGRGHRQHVCTRRHVLLLFGDIARSGRGKILEKVYYADPIGKVADSSS